MFLGKRIRFYDELTNRYSVRVISGIAIAYHNDTTGLGHDLFVVIDGSLAVQIVNRKQIQGSDETTKEELLTHGHPNVRELGLACE